MCLITCNKYPNKASVNITVYKIFIVAKNAKGETILYPPIMKDKASYPYECGLVLKPKKLPFPERILIGLFRLFGKNFAVKEYKDPITNNTIHYEVREGYLHCENRFYVDTLQLMMSDLSYMDKNTCYKIFKCCIPKGTKYYISEDGRQLAAKKLILIL